LFQKYATAAILEAQMGQDAGFAKSAHRAVFNYTPREGYLYVRSRAISSRCNDNFDMFPADEIEKAYMSFIGKPVFVNHHNDDHRRARGVIIDAALHRDVNPDGSPDTWVELLHEVDAVKFPKLAKAILAKEVNRTSMGCDVQFSKCSVCHNVASSPLEYCAHIPGKKGKRIFRVNASTGQREGQLVFEICSGLSFFENSLLVEQPADPTAFFLGEVEAGPGLGQLTSSVPKVASTQVVYESPRQPAFSKTASRRTSNVWDLIKQAAEDEGSTKAMTHESISQRINPMTRTIWRFITEAVHTGDNSLEAESIDLWGFTASGPVAGGPLSSNEDRHKLLEDKAGNGKGTRNLLDLVHKASRSDNDLHSGMKWYDDAHGVAKTIAEHHRSQKGHAFSKLSSEDALHRTAGTIGVYSSSSAPAPNIHMAMDAIHHGQAIYSKPVKDQTGKTVGNEGFNPNGEGHEYDRKGLPMADDKGAAKINSMLQDGKSIDEAWKGKAHKTRNFSHLINNPNAVDEKGRDRVVVDRHAIAAVVGHKGSSGEVYDNKNGPHFASLLSTQGGYEKVAQHYRDAADHINSSDEFQPLREKLHSHGLLQPGDRVRAHHVQALTWVQQKKVSGSRTTVKDQNQIDQFQGAYTHRYGDKAHKPTNWQGLVGGDDRHDKTGTFNKWAYGETKAPQDVDTLRAENCTVCGNSSAFDGKQCQVCGYVAPPKEFGDPNTDIARDNDLRKQVLEGGQADPMDTDQPMGNQQGDPEELENQQSDAEDGLDSSLGQLTCNACGTGVTPAAPVSDGGEPPYPAEGDVCPVCKQGQLMSEAQQAPEEGEDPEDTDNDGIPDEAEDADGDGVPDDQEDEDDTDDDEDEEVGPPKKKAPK
jgi:hypothetical protein